MLTARGKDAAKLLARCVALSLVLREQEHEESKKSKRQKTEAEYGDASWVDEEGDVCLPMSSGPVPPRAIGYCTQASFAERHRRWTQGEGDDDDEHEQSLHIHEPLQQKNSVAWLYPRADSSRPGSSTDRLVEKKKRKKPSHRCKFFDVGKCKYGHKCRFHPRRREPIKLK